MITQEQIDAEKAKSLANWITWLLAIVILVAALGFNEDMLELWDFSVIAGVLCVVILLLHIKNFRLPNRGTEASNDDLASNQGIALTLFAIGLIVFAGLTGSLSILFLDSVFGPGTHENFWFYFPVGIVNVLLWWKWTAASFDQKIDGRKISQLQIGGKYVRWGSNMRAAIWGVCKVLPFTDFLIAKLIPLDEDIKQLKQINTGSEDGEVIDVKPKKENSLNFPLVTKYYADYVIEDTFRYLSVDKPEEQIRAKIFGAMESTLHEIGCETVEEFRDQKPKISKSARDKITESFSELGLRLIKFEVTSIEKTKEEEKATALSRALVIETNGENLAELNKAKNLADMAKALKESTVGTDLSPIVLAMAISGDSRHTTLSDGDGKKSKKGDNGGNRTALQTLVTDSLHHRHGGHDGNDGNDGNGD